MYLYCKTAMDVNSVDSDDSSREDGEIVDDIDLEDISDYSIPSVVGKCDSNDDDLFRAISLGSISDSECNNQQTRSRQQQQLRILSSESYCKRKRRHRRRDRRKRSKISLVVDSPSPETITDCSNSDDSDNVDYETLHKLQKAVRINSSVNSGDCHHNSLRTRLKVMINNLTTESEDDIETLRALALISKGNKELEPVKDNNTEVVETILDDVNVETVLDDKELFELRSEALKSAILKKHQERKKRKENLHVNKENTVDPPPNNTIVDSETKIVENNSKKETSFEEDVDIMRAMLLASMSKKITSITPIVTPSGSNLVIKPTLPLITQTKSVKTSSLSLNNKLSLPPVKPLIININNGESDSESDSKSPKKATIFPNTQQTIKSTSADPSITKSVTEFLKLRRQQFEAKENNNNEELVVDKGKELSRNNGENCKDKSVVKLLPIPQQREYQLLKRKLLIAKRKKLLMKMNVEGEADKKSEDNGEKKQRTPTSLKATLADLQVRQNGRLQMKGKYDDLASLLQLVNRASIERKKCENTMKKILEELSGAKMALSRSHRDFTVLVQKLVQEKRNIDRREGASLVNSNTIRCTSTPLKSTCLKENNLEISKIISETSLLVAISAEKNCKSDELLRKEEETTLRYVSPLDNRALYDRGDGTGGVIADPLGTICPFELFGDCKDSLCHFVHCGRRSSNTANPS